MCYFIYFLTYKRIDLDNIGDVNICFSGGEIEEPEGKVIVPGLQD
jgi:hypothetical protein